MCCFKRIVFISGTRADYGKLKPLIKKVEGRIDTHVFVCGMHLLKQFGETFKHILSDGCKNVFCAKDIGITGRMDVDLAHTIISLSNYLQRIKPDLLVIHGDRIDALAGAIAGMLNNVFVAHIEGGEVTGAVDESIRHAITKMAHFHLVSNYESKVRIQQLGESKDRIYVIGSPDIDAMFSALPDLEVVKKQYKIFYANYAILIYHPVTTEYCHIEEHVKTLLEALSASRQNYIAIRPNNDFGNDIIIRELEKNISPTFKVFSSFQFESFLTLLKNADFIIGNSSAGIREACVYGIPSIDVGTRQSGRYQSQYLKNAQHVQYSVQDIMRCIDNIGDYRVKSDYFGKGNSADLFWKFIRSPVDVSIQKQFVDSSETENAISAYINEVCF